ncbi:MAG: prepilin-type N-terminal cleavage/methylation domain-containing protein [Rubrivivax sp.]|nr:prepilin-type N-terminal cleavage/methylation domain-containing protein [Rubrivivax sp.]
MGHLWGSRRSSGFNSWGDSRSTSHRSGQRGSLGRGFTMIELLIVIAIIAVGVALASVALPDGNASRLEEEGERLSALLEMARAESRVTGVAAYWVPRAEGEVLTDLQGAPVHFRFIGVSAALLPASRWLDARVNAQVVGARSVVLGPSAILPQQRIVLMLADQRLELVTDGLGPFAVDTAPGSAAATRP